MGRKRGTIMERKILIGIIVLFTVLVMIGIGHDYGEAIFKWFSRTKSADEAKTLAETPEEMEKTLEMEKLQKITSLVDSEEFLSGFSIDGVVEEIFGHNLIVQRSNEKGEEIFVTVPISEDVQVTCDGTEIAFDEIKKGDKVFVLLNQMQVILSDCPLEGIYMDVKRG